MRAWRCLLLVLCLWASWLTSAQPAPPPAKRTPEQERQWVKLQEDAGRYYNKAQYDKALESFEAMYQIDPNPLLLYNIGRCQEALGKKREAQRSYQLFLEKVPKTDDNYKKAKASAAALDKEIGPLPEPKAPLTERLVTQRPTAYYGVSLGLAGAGSLCGVITLRNAIALRDRVEDDTFAQSDVFTQRMRRAAVVSDVSFLLAAGAAWYGYQRAKSPKKATASLVLSSAGVSLVGGF
jgi:tetratricopeptide (TPR) repeat protein